MNRQGAAQLRISPLHIQQGLFALLAFLITLIGGQQFLRWEQSQQPETPPHLSIPHAPQTHFSAVSNQADSDSMRMMDVDQAQPVDETPQERWVF